MYYNSNKYANDYYNAYKQEMKEVEVYKKTNHWQKIINIALIVVTSMLLFLSLFYIYKFFYSSSTQTKSSNIDKKKILNEEILPVVTTNYELPQSPQLRDLAKRSDERILENATDTLQYTTDIPHKELLKKESPVNTQEIQHIVKLVMSHMTAETEAPLKKQLDRVEKKNYTEVTLKNSNHYNKIILSSEKSPNEALENRPLLKLTDESQNSKQMTEYATSIKRELSTRTNAMRIIIVQEGDTLSKIAKRAYGSYDAYQKIFSANPEILENPNQIFIGQRLRIPS